MKDIEQIIREVDGTMAIEGMPLNPEEKERIRECLTERISFNEMKQEVANKMDKAFSL